MVKVEAKNAVAVRRVPAESGAVRFENGEAIRVIIRRVIVESVAFRDNTETLTAVAARIVPGEYVVGGKVLNAEAHIVLGHHVIGESVAGREAEIEAEIESIDVAVLNRDTCVRFNINPVAC